MKIGWIGCGNMGRPMALNILKAGYDVTVFDVVKENLTELVAAGAKKALSPKEVGEASDLIFSMLPNGNIVQKVVLGEKDGLIAGMSKGKVLIDTSTIAPDESEVINAALQGIGCPLLRAPVTGSTDLAKKAALGIFVSGKKEIYELVLPVLKCISNNQHFLGEGEQSRVLKLAINLMIAINLQMLAETMMLVDKCGLDKSTALDIIGKSAVGAPVINYKIDNVVNDDYAAAFSVSMMEKDLDLALAAAKSYNIGLPLTALTRQFLAIADSSGNGDKDFSYLVKMLQEISSTK